jgi:hypothetical protein
MKGSVSHCLKKSSRSTQSSKSIEIKSEVQVSVIGDMDIHTLPHSSTQMLPTVQGLSHLSHVSMLIVHRLHNRAMTDRGSILDVCSLTDSLQSPMRIHRVVISAMSGWTLRIDSKNFNPVIDDILRILLSVDS